MEAGRLAVTNVTTETLSAIREVSLCERSAEVPSEPIVIFFRCLYISTAEVPIHQLGIPILTSVTRYIAYNEDISIP